MSPPRRVNFHARAGGTASQHAPRSSRNEHRAPAADTSASGSSPPPLLLPLLEPPRTSGAHRHNKYMSAPCASSCSVFRIPNPMSGIQSNPDPRAGSGRHFLSIALAETQARRLASHTPIPSSFPTKTLDDSAASLHPLSTLGRRLFIKEKSILRNV
ncbi:MAG: hypothetical protein UY77_C0002G0015 [Candidatus Uhrbacteria bacterium GW2011_GWA2_53_10]|uniref:Uncharacterized protein n=1 Tax=Candidatus Uhrbacteria bacterium GW2011_GWA2_53_10 TaxID=1618980 RepID=A0A0G1ZXX1_9BACT|nr:MAG: hypothetical protein UY77_C0002G0015 [Candidatus Uhrbacteria bacterium GW2011_GWA2_53_10]